MSCAAATPLTLNAPVQAVYVPAMRVELGDAVDERRRRIRRRCRRAGRAGGGEGCGRISVFDRRAARRAPVWRAHTAARRQHAGAARDRRRSASAPANTSLLVAENIPTQALGVGESPRCGGRRASR